MSLTYEETDAIERICHLVRETNSTIHKIGRPIEHRKIAEITTSLSEIETNILDLLSETPSDQDGIYDDISDVFTDQILHEDLDSYL